MSRTITLALALLAVLALAACSQQEPEVTLEEQVPAAQRQDDAATEAGADAEGGGGDGGDAVTFQAFDLGYEAPTTELPAGEVTIALENTGNLPHDITVEELGDETIVEAGGGETAESSVSLDPGTYTFYCSVPGHRAAMELTVEVTE